MSYLQASDLLLWSELRWTKNRSVVMNRKILKGKVILRRLEFEISVFIFKWIVKKVNQLNLPLAERIEQEKNANLSNLSLK